MAKKAYRVRNWSQYNKALTQRGSLTLWINEETVQKWYELDTKPKGRGRPKTYSSLSIETCATLRVLFNLPFRQCEGFVQGLFSLLGVAVDSPSYTQLCRRMKKIEIKLKHNVQGPLHVVVDATGLKIFGEGEWKVRQHGYTKHRMWRKLHLGLDVATKKFVMFELTDNHIGESKLLKPLLDQYCSGSLRKVGGDKGYDSYACHEEIGKRGAISAILPQEKAKVRARLGTEDRPFVRDEIVSRINCVGREKWKEEVGYHQRSLIENGFFRFKTIFGAKLRSICLKSQKIEALIGCNILNRFTDLGMPNSYIK